MSDKNYIQKDHIHFEGYITNTVNKEGQNAADHLSKVLIYNMGNIGTYSEERYEAKYLPISDQLDKLHFVISAYPAVRANVSLSDNTVRISLYILALFNSLGTFRELIDIFKSNYRMNFDEISGYFSDTQKSAEAVREMDQLVRRWNSYSFFMEDGAVKSKWNFKEAIDIDSDYIYSLNGIKLILHHELAHWHLFRFNEKSKNLFIGSAATEMLDYVKTKYPNDIGLANHLTEHMVLEWAEEIAADTMSISSVLNYCTTQVEMRDVFIAIGLFYSLLDVQEYLTDGNKLGSHPPVTLRESVVVQLLAKARDMSAAEFIAYMAGTWYVYRTVFGIVIENYDKYREGIK